jgi:biopolymer transport protein ExbD
MAMSVGRPARGAIAEINVTPMADGMIVLRAAFETRGDRTLFVKVEDDVAYERVVAVIDAAQGAGASRIGLVEPPDTGALARALP